jgi:hypothetical protein
MKRLTGLLICALAGCGALAAETFAAGTPSAGLAFIKDTHVPPTVWAANARGGDQRKLGAGSDALLSPNGEMVAAAGATGKGPGLIVYRVSGGSVKLMPKLTGIAVTPLAWSPDSRYLAVSIADSGTGEGAGNARLDVIDTTTGAMITGTTGIVRGASFAPTLPERLVVSLGQSQLINKPANLYMVTFSRSRSSATAGIGPLTENGRSINPVWGRRGIVFDKYTLRGVSEAPAYQLELLHDGRVRPIASPRPPALLDGLTPLAISADGEHLIAVFGGEDTALAYTVNLVTNRYRMVTGVRYGVQPWGISRNGNRLLVSFGGFEEPTSHATIATVPFTGGPLTPLVKGGDLPSWDQ